MEWAVKHKVPVHRSVPRPDARSCCKRALRAGARRERNWNKAGIKLGLHTLSAVNIAETSPFVTKAADEYLAAYLDAAQHLGAGWIVVHGGYHFGSDKKVRMDAAVARIARAAKAAEKKKVKLLLENLNPEPEQRRGALPVPTTSRSAATTSTGSTRRRSAGASPSTTPTSSPTASTRSCRGWT